MASVISGKATKCVAAEEASAKKKGLLKDQLALEKYATTTGGVRFTVKPIDAKLPFDKGFFVVIRALQLLTSHNEGTIAVGLAGPSGSGKTAFSEKLKSFMPGVAIISMDNYNDSSKVVDDNFDDPRLADYDLLLDNIQQLKAGMAVKIPIYDFKQGKRKGYTTLEVPTSRVVIVEGIYALSERLREHLDLRVSITGGVHFDLVKRVLRDLDRSGQAPEEIIQQISDTVYPMYKAFIEPDLETAHLKIHNTFNPFSGFMNATYILKSQKTITVEEAESVLQPDIKRGKESEIVDIYLLPPNEDPDTCSSWLRMRNRDGRYSLLFEEWVNDWPYLISPRISFEVSVKVLGGLMALGYEIGALMKRKSVSYSDADITIKFDAIDKLGSFVQIQGKDRNKVAEAGKALGLDGTYLATSYIEQVQLEKLTSELRHPGNLSQHFGDYLFGSRPIPAADFPASRGMSLPTRLSLPPSLPMPIAGATPLESLPVAVHACPCQPPTGNGLRSHRMSNGMSTDDLGAASCLSQQASSSVSMKDELVYIVRLVAERLGAISESVSPLNTIDVCAQLQQLRCECAQLRQAVTSLSNSTECLVTQLQGVKDGIAAVLSPFGIWAPSVIGVAGFSVVLGYAIFKRS